MEKNIFENAKFGDKFLTSSGNLVVFQKEWMTFNQCKCYIVFNEAYDYQVNPDGTVANSEYDTAENVISKYQESIDEDKLDEFIDEAQQWMFTQEDDGTIVQIHTLEEYNSYKEGLIRGYKKAKEK